VSLPSGVNVQKLLTVKSKLPSLSAVCVPVALPVTKTSSLTVTNKFSSIDNAGVVPTAEPKPITKSSALSSNPT